MSAYVIHDTDGNARSIATGTPPAGATAVVITDAQFAALTNGESRWDVPTRTVVPDTARQQVEANTATINGQLDQTLDAMRAHVTRGTFTAAQRDSALLLLLRVCVGLVRLARNRFDGTD